MNQEGVPLMITNVPSYMTLPNGIIEDEPITNFHWVYSRISGGFDDAIGGIEVSEGANRCSLTFNKNITEYKILDELYAGVLKSPDVGNLLNIMM